MNAELEPSAGARQRDLFLNALEKTDPLERAAFLEVACGADQALRESVEQLLREQEEAILHDLKSRGFADPAVAQKALVRSLAGTQILLHFEKLSASIWASQINLLTYLNSRPAGASLTEVRPFYENAKQQNAPIYHNYPFEPWLAFLESFHLIERNQEMILLSKVGREFLKWRIEVGRAGPFFG